MKQQVIDIVRLRLSSLQLKDMVSHKVVEELSLPKECVINSVRIHHRIYVYA